MLGVPIANESMQSALARIDGWLDETAGPAHAVHFANAHTLNVTCDEPAYRRVLAGADVVYGDGTGVRWAVRWLHGTELVDNVNGTDLVPTLFRTRANRGYRYYLLGGTPEMSAGAAAYARATFAGWELVGHHHGYLDAASNAEVLTEIERVRPHLVLVGMGNPHQERWIDANRARVAARVCAGVGGIFAYWSGDLDRAAPWVRAIGFEWLHLLRRQPSKARRYLVGNPLFLARVWAARRAQRTASVP